MSGNNCPYCNGKLLRHINHGEVYWFCRSCWVKEQAPFTFIYPHSEENGIPNEVMMNCNGE